MSMNYNSENSMNSQVQNLANSEDLFELNTDELDDVAGGRDLGGRVIGRFIHRRIDDARDTVGGFIKGVLFG